MKRLFCVFVFFCGSFHGFTQTRVGIDLARLVGSTVDIGVTHILKDEFFLSARAGYGFERKVPKRYGISNLTKSYVSGSFIAGGIGFDVPRVQDTNLYMGIEIMADWGQREDELVFEGIYGQERIRTNQNFTTIGMNVYLGRRNHVWKNCYFDVLARINFIQCDPGQLDRVVSPSTGVDWNGDDGSTGINLNVVCKLIYQFGSK